MAVNVKRPVAQAPTRVPINRVDTDFNMNPEWERWLNQVSEHSYDIRVFLPTINPASVSSNSSGEQTFTVEGITTDDIILTVNKPSHTTNFGILGFRPGDSDDELSITFINHRGSAVDAPEEEYRVAVLKRK